MDSSPLFLACIIITLPSIIIIAAIVPASKHNSFNILLDCLNVCAAMQEELKQLSRKPEFYACGVIIKAL